MLARSGGPTIHSPLSVPPRYRGEPVALVLALHFGGDPDGAGRSMLDILIQPALGDLGAVIVAPDSLSGGWGSPQNERAVNTLLDAVGKSYAIDQKKTIVTGYSMGGAGTWYWADKYPERFSAAVPVSGRPTSSAAAWRVPAFAVHSRNDQVNPIGPTEQRIAKLKKKGVNAQIAEDMKGMSGRPHHLGSAYDKDNAEWILSKFKEWGWDARIENYDVLFPTPKERLVEMVAPSAFKLKLEEPAVAADPTSGQKTEQLPSFNAYSIDGDVTAPLVYVNYGRPQDYDDLDRRGISVNGAIVIARYGASWRGIKPKVAAEHGAVGCLIYSDPMDDGYVVDDVFPDGPMRNSSGVQRGSVMDMPTYPGDPLTPGIGATPDAQRLGIKDVTTLTKIPVLPISYADAQSLLSALRGRVAPGDWRGALPITYHLGPGPARVHMKVAFNWDRARIYDVVARIQGSTYPDEWVIRAKHPDARDNGAVDRGAGMSSEHERARA